MPGDVTNNMASVNVQTWGPHAQHNMPIQYINCIRERTYRNSNHLVIAENFQRKSGQIHDPQFPKDKLNLESFITESKSPVSQSQT